MKQLPSPDVLDETLHVTLIVRALIRRAGTVLYGEVINAVNGARSPFVGWRGLIRAIHSRLEALG